MFRQRFLQVLLAIIASIALLIVLIRLGYNVEWSGFGGKSAKTLWDWMQLLIVPIVLAVGALLFNLATSQTERKIALDKQQEDVLQAYLDHLSDLLLKEHLRTSPEEEVRDVARVRTITILNQLDTNRKNHVFSFLREAKLITSEPRKSIITFSQTSLSGINLKQVNLSEADLSEADLRGADLSEALLIKANLREADLKG